MTPEEEAQTNELLELVSSLANLTQQQSLMINTITEQNQMLLARLASFEAIGKAMQ